MTAMERVEAPLEAGERTMLNAWLDYHRATLAMKCEGLTSQQLRERAVPPSTLSLLGLVRHMADVERGWFRRGLAGEDAPPLYYGADNPDGDFDDVDAADAEEAFAAWDTECAAAREQEASAPNLEVTFDRHGDPRERFSLRWLLLHMIEEYARHNGHADLLRQRLDGATGE